MIALANVVQSRVRQKGESFVQIVNRGFKNTSMRVDFYLLLEVCAS